MENTNTYAPLNALFMMKILLICAKGCEVASGCHVMSRHVALRRVISRCNVKVIMLSM
jgi:hypothetical protein